MMEYTSTKIKDTPKVSIVTACFNSMKFIEDTWDSIKNQGDTSFEWIVVDDGSTDGTREFLKSMKDIRIHTILFEINKGIGPAYQAGVDSANGEYVLILDHDDTLPKGSLDKRVKLLEECSDCMVAFGGVSYMTEDGTIYKKSKFPFVNSSGYLSPSKVLLGVFLMPSYPLKQGCVLLRQSIVAESSGIFDINLFLRAVTRSKAVAYINDPCLNYRTFRGQFSSSRWKRTLLFMKLDWSRYALSYLPWYVSPIASIYRVFIELLKVIWCYVSPKRIG